EALNTLRSAGSDVLLLFKRDLEIVNMRATSQPSIARDLILSILEGFNDLAQRLKKASTIVVVPRGEEDITNVVSNPGKSSAEVLNRGLCQRSLATGVAHWLSTSQSRNIFQLMLAQSDEETDKILENFVRCTKHDPPLHINHLIKHVRHGLKLLFCEMHAGPGVTAILIHCYHHLHQLPCNRLPELVFLVQSSEMISKLTRDNEVWFEGCQRAYIGQSAIIAPVTDRPSSPDHTKKPESSLGQAHQNTESHLRKSSQSTPWQGQAESQQNETDLADGTGMTMIIPGPTSRVQNDTVAENCMPNLPNSGNTWSAGWPIAQKPISPQPSTTNFPPPHPCNPPALGMFCGSEMGRGGFENIGGKGALNGTNDASTTSTEVHAPLWDPTVHDIATISTISNEWNLCDDSIFLYPEHDIDSFTTWPQNVNQTIDRSNYPGEHDITWLRNVDQRMDRSNCFPEHGMVATSTTWPQNYIPEHDIDTFTTWPQNVNQTMNHPNYLPEHGTPWPQNAKQRMDRSNDLPEHDIAAFTTWPAEYSLRTAPPAMSTCTAANNSLLFTNREEQEI
ncbi:MAG: hypothetical protein L6R36_009050, partial [Xanthoria steineri]